MAKIGVGGTGFGQVNGTTIDIYLTNQAGEAILVTSDGTPSTIIGAVSGYAKGCICEDTVNATTYKNAGTSTTSSWT